MSDWDAFPLASQAHPDPWAAYPLASTTAQPESATLQSGIAPLDAMHNFTEQAGRALTFGLQDKAGALANAGASQAVQMFGGDPAKWNLPAGGFGQAYQTDLQRQRAAGDTYAENNPIASKVATGVGTVASLAPNSAPAGAEWLGQMYRDLGSGRFTKGYVPLGNVAPAAGVSGMAKQGAVAGGLTGFGQSDDQSALQDLQDTGQGALAGGLTGAALGGARAFPIPSFLSKLEHSAVGGIGFLAALEHDPRIAAAIGIPLATWQAAKSIPPRMYQAVAPVASRAVSGLLNYGSQ